MVGGDTWWAFVAQIDRAALLRELPGSVLDRRLREEHAEAVETFYAPRHPERALKPRLKKATELDNQIAAYAASKRKRNAA